MSETKKSLIEKGLFSQYLIDVENGKIAYDEENPESPIFYTDRINFVDDETIKTWNHAKEYLLKNIKFNLFFISHSRDTIKGKAQLIDNVQRKIPLLRDIITKTKDMEGNESHHFCFFDEKIDKRLSVSVKEQIFSLNFRLYRVVDESSKEYYILSEYELPNGVCEFHGMIIPLEDFADMNKNLKLKSISNVFILKDFIPAVKVLSKEQIVNYTKDRKITANDWISFLNSHPQGTFNNFPEEVNQLRSAWLLSGKVDGYPLHIWIWGRTGTKKSMGYIETLAYKFEENFPIFEGGNSRVKGLTPSFKEKPANLGYLAKANRIAFVDEVGKMAEFEMNKHDTQTNNIFGELNFLLEHKCRLVGSGNDNDIKVQADAKVEFVSNPLSKKDTLAAHIGIIDATTLSRGIQWVQDYDETSFMLSPCSISKIPPSPTSIYVVGEKGKKDMDIYMCGGKVNSRDEFLTLFDTCNSFISEIEDLEVEKLNNTITLLAKEPMKSSIWKPRGLHHVKLLIDGLCKYRCLFEDYDSCFKANKTDYERAEKILIRMVHGWETNFNKDSWKETFGGSNDY